jgi:hypothetical protein
VPDQDTVSRLQIFLDEHSFGPGKIDGSWGEFIGKALQRFQAAHGQQPSGQIDSALQQELQKISPVYTTYALTDSDLHWVGKVPSKPAGMAQLKRILYRSAANASRGGCARNFEKALRVFPLCWNTTHPILKIIPSRSMRF